MTTSLPFEDNPASIYRLLDAAINRCGEGLRVVEDYSRMVLDDRHLTESLKALRHEITAIATHIDPSFRIASRDTQGDVGTQIELASEYQRGSSGGLVQANLARVQQALRTIEEFSKAVLPGHVRQVEQARYRCYTLEKALLTTVLSTQLLSTARLYVLVDGGESLDKFRGLVRELVAGGVDLIQLRAKSLEDRQVLQRAAILNEELRGLDTRWVMNDRADLAAAGKAAGVHLGQTDLPVADARRIVGPTKFIGVSTHSLEEARQAVLDGANYIGVGPVYPSRTKDFSSHVGLNLLRQVTDEIRLPAFAIGGIGPHNLSEVLSVGRVRVAVSNSVLSSPSPRETVALLKHHLGSKPVGRASEPSPGKN